MAADALFGPIFTTDELLELTGDRAWLTAMLDAEAALAAAEADCGVIPREAADAIAAACRPEAYDPAELGRAARGGANPVIPLVAALTAAVGAPASAWVHWGATSQDILDTAAMILCRRAGAEVLASTAALAAACAATAEDHRRTLMTARTLLQPALPTTFGAKAAGWLTGVLDAESDLDAALGRLSAQLGGAAGTLASLGPAGPAVLACFARRTGLAEPRTPWHTARQRVSALGAALAVVAATAAKVTGDVALLMQAEVGEASEPASAGRGGSSTLPQKRNPVAAVATAAAARRAAALVPVLIGAVTAEHERPVGAWHAEWQPLSELLALAGGAAAHAAETTAGLEIHRGVMESNLRERGALLLAERVVLALTPRLGRARARGAVAEAVSATAAGGEAAFAGALLGQPGVAEVLPDDELHQLLDPAGYVGCSDEWIDRVLAAYRTRVLGALRAPEPAS